MAPRRIRIASCTPQVTAFPKPQGDACWARRDNGGVRLSLKSINAELTKRGLNVALAKGDGYFYFASGEAADWLDRTVRVPTLHILSVEQWIDELQKLREQNRNLMHSVQKPSEESAGPAPEARSTRSRR